MRIEGRVFRGLLDVLALWGRTGGVIAGGQFCVLRPLGPELLGVEFPTEAGWL